MSQQNEWNLIPFNLNPEDEAIEQSHNELIKMVAKSMGLPYGLSPMEKVYPVFKELEAFFKDYDIGYKDQRD